MKKRRFQCLYTVYDNKTDFPVIVCGTSEQCARVMGIALGSFYSSVTSRGRGRWTVMVERGVDLTDFR